MGSKLNRPATVEYSNRIEVRPSAPPPPVAPETAPDGRPPRPHATASSAKRAPLSAAAPAARRNSQSRDDYFSRLSVPRIVKRLEAAKAAGIILDSVDRVAQPPAPKPIRARAGATSATTALSFVGTALACFGVGVLYGRRADRPRGGFVALP